MESLNMSAFFNQPFLQTKTSSQSDLLPLLLELHNTMSQQQKMLELLLQNEQQKYSKLPQFDLPQMISTSNYTRLLPSDILSHQFQNSPLPSNSCSFENDSNHSSNNNIYSRSVETLDRPIIKEEDSSCQTVRENSSKIMRRNGFNKESCQNQTKLINKPISSKCKASKANHLWINYGRKIIDFALTQTKDEVCSRIKLLIGKLQCKRDFQDIFGLKESDSEWDRQFKVLFGNLALFFIQYKAEEAFQDSKLKDQMNSNKMFVSTFIKELITQVNN